MGFLPVLLTLLLTVILSFVAASFYYVQVQQFARLLDFASVLCLPWVLLPVLLPLRIY